MSDSGGEAVDAFELVRPADLAGVRAVVVDANIMGKRGDLRVDLLRRLNDIATRDGHLEVLVPEPVLWEWQEHATREHAEAARSLSESASRLARAGLELPALSWSAEEVRSAVLTAVRAFTRVRIIPLQPEQALQALRDQVLVLPPGERLVVGTKSVKTGASDSAWIRAAHADAGGQSGSYVVLTNDSDAKRAYEHWGWELPLLLPSINVLVKLFEGTAFPELTPDTVVAMLGRLLDEDWYSPAFDLVDEGGLAKKALGDDGDYLNIDLSLNSITSVAGFSHLEVVDRVGSVQGFLYLIGEVDVTGWRHTAVTDQLDANYVGGHRCLLRTSIQLTPADDEPRGLWLSFEDSSAVHPLTGDWSAPEDALQALLEAVETLPGCGNLTLPDGYVSGAVVQCDRFSPDPITMSVDNPSGSEEWTATISRGDVFFTMTCVLTDSNYFGDTWILRGEVSTAAGEVIRIEDAWTGVSYLLASFVDSPSSDRNYHH